LPHRSSLRGLESFLTLFPALRWAGLRSGAPPGLLFRGGADTGMNFSAGGVLKGGVQAVKGQKAKLLMATS
jgi:hypothetical protein